MIKQIVDYFYPKEIVIENSGSLVEDILFLNYLKNSSKQDQIEMISGKELRRVFITINIKELDMECMVMIQDQYIFVRSISGKYIRFDALDENTEIKVMKDKIHLKCKETYITIRFLYSIEKKAFIDAYSRFYKKIIKIKDIELEEMEEDDIE